MKNDNTIKRIEKSIAAAIEAARMTDGDTFFRRPGADRWSVAEELLHVSFCLVPVIQSSRATKLLLRKYGVAQRSRNEEEFLADYELRTRSHDWKTMPAFVARKTGESLDAIHGFISDDVQVVEAFYGQSGSAVDRIPEAMLIGPETDREDVLRFAIDTGEKLMATLLSLDEHLLDRVQTPLPYMGLVTLHELLYFTIMHTCHHRDRLVLKRKELLDSGEAGVA